MGSAKINLQLKGQGKTRRNSFIVLEGAFLMV